MNQGLYNLPSKSIEGGGRNIFSNSSSYLFTMFFQPKEAFYMLVLFIYHDSVQNVEIVVE